LIVNLLVVVEFVKITAVFAVVKVLILLRVIAIALEINWIVTKFAVDLMYLTHVKFAVVKV